MIGNNSMDLNEATMIVAIQEFLDTRLVDKGSILVTSIKANNAENVFRINFKSIDPVKIVNSATGEAT